MRTIARTWLSLPVAVLLALVLIGPAAAAPPPQEDAAAGAADEKARRKAERQQQKETERRQREQDRLEREAGMTPELSRDLARFNERIRSSRLADEPEVVRYLDKIDTGLATAPHFAALGQLLSDLGAYEGARIYYLEAIQRDPENTDLWTNLGSIHRKAGDVGSAIAAFKRALDLDPNNAVAHYNLGAAYHYKNKYDEAMREYTTAFILDPDLADPALNPLVVNNQMMLPLQMVKYRTESGALTLPLIEIPGGELPPAGR